MLTFFQLTKEDFEDCLDDIGKNLGELQNQQTSLNRMFDFEMKKLLDELTKKISLDEFDSFKRNIDDGKLRGRRIWGTVAQALCGQLYPMPHQ